jgi:hypothetical protein
VFSIYKRAGWHFGVPDTYIFVTAGGDQHVGRAVCGLPSTSVDFAALPPYFKQVSAEHEREIVDFVKLCFPGIPNTKLASSASVFWLPRSSTSPSLSSISLHRTRCGRTVRFSVPGAQRWRICLPL